MKVEVVDRGQVVKDIKRVPARFIYFFGVADHREVPLGVVKNRMTVMRTVVEFQPFFATTFKNKMIW